MAFKYNDPLTRGYTKFKLTRKQHNEIFPNYKVNWVVKCEYYYKDDNILIHRFTSPLAVVVNILLIPVAVLMNGLGNIKEICRDYKRILNQKETGDFSTDFVYKDNEKFNKIKELIK